MTVMEASHGLREARRELDQACALLQSPTPEVLERCSNRLQAACTEVAGWLSRADHWRGNGDLKAEVEGFAAAVHRARSLLDTAVEYHTRWNRFLGSKFTGYQAGGQAVPLAHVGRVWVRG